VKKILTSLIIIAIALSMAMPVYGEETAVSFSDVKPGQWFYNDVMILTSKGIIKGVTTPVNGVGKYDPQGTVTLGQFLAISTRLVAKEHIKEVPNAKHWAEANYHAAVESGLIQSGDFGSSAAWLDSPISREDMAYILVNIAKAERGDAGDKKRDQKQHRRLRPDSGHKEGSSGESLLERLAGR
jgi:hypothetical protein